jgi:phenylalanyl-tRNA synthetase beta chain
MKTSIAWLNRYLDRPTDADEADAVFTAVGFPIDDREDVPDVSGGGAGGDVMLDVEVTSNRPDCLSHLGLARELAAATGRSLQLPKRGRDLDAADSPAGVAAGIVVVNQHLDLCPLYTARVIRGVTVGPSPAWLRHRLAAVGLRSVNNLVDVTNFILHELGQPLHAFDLAKLDGSRIVVRPARDGEHFTAIDGSKHQLTDRTLVIADANVPVAIAGVMGGLDSEVGPATRDILLEAAVFEPLSVRRAARRLKLASDSSFRFERGVDWHGVERASRRAVALMVEVAGGVVCGPVVRVGRDDPPPRAITMRLPRCHAILGREVAADRAVTLLDRLGLAPQLQSTADGQVVHCSVPSHRLDLRREIDLIEEVARLDGYDNIAVRDRIQVVVQPPQVAVQARQLAAQALVAHGYHETVTFSFVPERLGEPFIGATASALRIDDERRRGEAMLRPSLLPSLLTCRKTNQDAGNVSVRLFEIASTWTRASSQPDSAIRERTDLALLADAPERDAQSALRDLRGTLEELVQRLAGAAAFAVRPLDVGDAQVFAAAGEVIVAGEKIGVLGVASPALLQRFDLQTPAVMAELDWPRLRDLYPPRITVTSPPRFPAIERDLSVVLDEATPWSRIAEEIAAAQVDLMEDVRFITTYRGKPIPPGRKSVSLRMHFRDEQATLRHDQVDPQVSAVIARLREKLGAELRA